MEYCYMVEHLLMALLGHWIYPSWGTHWAISRSIQCVMTGVTKAMVCVILCWMVHIKEQLLIIGMSSPCGDSRFPLTVSDPLSYVQCHITINKMCRSAWTGKSVSHMAYFISNKVHHKSKLYFRCSIIFSNFTCHKTIYLRIHWLFCKLNCNSLIIWWPGS